MVNRGWLKKMVKKISGFLLVLLMLVSMAHAACAAEKIIQLTVPGCFS